MKKNYFFGTLIALLMMTFIVPANAQVSSMVDLFGKYQFSAEMEISKDGDEYKDKFSNNCEVILTSDKSDNPYVTWDAVISGFAGATANLNVNGINTDEKKFKIQNWAGNSYWGGGTYMSLEDGAIYYGKDEEMWFTYNEDTKEISIPNFTITLPDFAADSAVVLATFKNVKLTLIAPEKINIEDISGDWKAKGLGTYGTKPGSVYPSEYSFVLTKGSEENNKHNYAVDLTIGAYPVIKLNATFDGNKLEIPYNDVMVDETTNLLLCNQWVNDSSSFSFTYSSAASLDMDKVLCLGIKKDTLDSNGADSTFIECVQWWMNGSAKKVVAESDKFDWRGKYIVSAATPDDVTSYDGNDYNQEFEMVIDTIAGGYYITEFFGYNVGGSLNSGGIPVVPSADNSKEASITTNGKYAGSLGGGLYYKLYDGEGNNGPISLKVNEDSTITMGNFFIRTLDYMNQAAGETDNVSYENLTVTRKIEKPYNFEGVYDFTATVTSEDGGEYLDKGLLVALYNDYSKKYIIHWFLGNNTYSLNYGALAIAPAADDLNGGTIATGMVFQTVVSGEEYLYIYDDKGEEGDLKVFNAGQDAFHISDFTLYKQPYGKGSNKVKAAVYSNVMIVKNDMDPAGIENTVAAAAAGISVNGSSVLIEGAAQQVSVYDVAGRAEFSGVTNCVSNLSKGVHIVKVGNIVAKVNIK